MPAFIIKGLRVINGMVEPITHILQDPAGTYAKPDAAFIVRAETDKTFYYYEQMNKLWIRARLSEGVPAEANLQFYKLIFSKDDVYTLGVEPAIVNGLISPEHKRVIKNQLISVTAEYSRIKAENPLALVTAMISQIEETYDGKLSAVHRSLIDGMLAISGIEKPKKPAAYTGTDTDWDGAWDKGLAFTLSASERNFEQNMPKDTPAAIKVILNEVMNYLKPARINGYRFDGLVSELPTIGQVHDHIRQYFSKMLTNQRVATALNPIKLPTILYNMPVGQLNSHGVLADTGLSQEQSELLSALCSNFTRYEDAANYPEYLANFTVLDYQSFPILVLEYMIDLFSDNVWKTESDEDFLNNFYAIASASRQVEDYTLFDQRYSAYKALACEQLRARVDTLKVYKAGILSSEDPLVYMNDVRAERVGSLILSLTREELLPLCEISGFITAYNLPYILKIIPTADLTGMKKTKLLASQNPDLYINSMPELLVESIIASLTREQLLPLCNISGFITITNLKFIAQKLTFFELSKALPGLTTDSNGLINTLHALPAESTPDLLTLLGAERLKAVITNGYILGQVLVNMTEPLAITLIETLGRDAVHGIIATSEDLRNALYWLDIPLRLKLIKSLESAHLRSLISTGKILGQVFTYFPTSAWPALIRRLGADHMKLIIKDVAALKDAFLWNPHASVITFIESMRTALGPDVIKHMVVDGDGLKKILEMLGDESAMALLRKLGADLISDFIKTPDQLCDVLYSLTEESKPSLIDFLGHDRVWAKIETLDQMVRLYCSLPDDAQLILIDKMGTRLSDMIKNISDLQKVLSIMRLPAQRSLLEKLGPERIRVIVRDAEDLGTLLYLRADSLQANIIDMMGPRIVDILDTGGSRYFHHTTPECKLMIERAYAYHSQYHMKRAFNPDEINASIESIFSKATEQYCFGPPFGYWSNTHYAEKILAKCKENPTPTVMLEFLREQLKLMDEYAKGGMFSSHAKSDCDLAMRIIYCIEQLKYHINPVKPALSLVEKKAWNYVLPRGAYLGLATAGGIGLVLAFSPISMIGPLHLTMGAIIGVATVAALITMALYIIAMRELFPKKDFTDKGLFMSWSVCNKADAAKVGANMDVGAPYHRAHV